MSFSPISSVSLHRFSWWLHQAFPRYWPFVRGIPSQSPVTRSFDVFFDLRLSKQSRLPWFETPRSNYDVIVMYADEAHLRNMSISLKRMGNQSSLTATMNNIAALCLILEISPVPELINISECCTLLISERGLSWLFTKNMEYSDIDAIYICIILWNPTGRIRFLCHKIASWGRNQSE